MRVLSISSDRNALDEYSVVAERLRMQARMVERLDVLVPHGPKHLVQIAGNASVRGFGLGKYAGALRAVAAGMRIQKPDIVSAQDPFYLGAIAWVVARMRGSYLHLQVHTDLFNKDFLAHSFSNRVRVMLAEFLLRRADCVRVVSERISTAMKDRNIRTPHSVLPVYIDLDAVRAAETLDRRARYPHFKKILLVVSRLEKEKQVDHSIRALAEIRKSEPGAGLVIVGAGKERVPLEALAREYGISEWVVFEGSQNPFPFYKTADALLVTSAYDGFGMVTVEALAAGCPVLSYDVGVAREAGAVVVTKESLARVAVAVLSERKPGKLSMPLLPEGDHRERWLIDITTCVPAFAQPRPASVEVGATPSVGFVGQGFIGKNYSDEMESRGIPVIRYSLEEQYRANKDKIKDCDVVFIAVPTPTTPDGFDFSIVESAVSLVGKGKTAVIKSTMLPGTTENIQAKYPDRVVMHSPEFLREATAAYDAAHPDRNIIGVPADTPENRRRAEQVLRVLPHAPFELMCSLKEAEIIKYAGNNWLFTKVVYVNLLYEFAEAIGARYDMVRDALAADPRIGRSHLDPIHQSGHGGTPGRGAGGHCFIKDFAAFREGYERMIPDDSRGIAALRAFERKNIELLLDSEKDVDLLKGVYGEDPRNALVPLEATEDK
jgi:glycosyltransferase involved in cell wall biosynthesis